MSYNVRGQDGEVCSLNEGNESFDSVIKVVISESKGVVLDHVGKLQQRLVLEEGVPR